MQINYHSLHSAPLSTLESGFKNMQFRCRIRRMRADGSRNRKEKVADSKISGYVWTEPKCKPFTWKMLRSSPVGRRALFASFSSFDCAIEGFQLSIGKLNIVGTV